MTKTLAFAAFAVSAGLAGAQATYYTVDIVNDQLYKIDVNTGVATVLGPLNTDLDLVDLAWHQGALYAKSVSSANGARVYQLVHTGVWAGYALAGGTLSGGGYQGAEAAGLASNGSGLFLTYSPFAPVNFSSNRFASVNPLTGAIGTPTGLNYDADSLGFASGQFWSVDVVAPGQGCDIYRGPAAPTTWVGNIAYDTMLDTNPVDVEDFSVTQLVAVGQSGKYLVRLFKATGAKGLVLPITGVPANAHMRGIARNPGCAIEIPKL